MPLFPEVKEGLLGTFIPFIVAALILYFDSVSSGGATNPAVFASIVIIWSILMGGENAIKNPAKVFGLDTTPIKAFIQSIAGIGVIFIIFFSIARPASIIMPSLYSSIFPFYSPIQATSVQFGVSPAWYSFFSTMPTSYYIIFFMLIAVFEEFLKIVGVKRMANTLYDKYGINAGRSVAISLIVVYAAWIMLHFASWGGITPLSLMTGIIYGLIFFLPYYLVGEPLESPDPEIQWNSIKNFTPISAHFTWDILVALMQLGIISGISVVSGTFFGIMFFGAAIILAFLYKKTNGFASLRSEPVGWKQPVGGW